MKSVKFTIICMLAAVSLAHAEGNVVDLGWGVSFVAANAHDGPTYRSALHFGLAYGRRVSSQVTFMLLGESQSFDVDRKYDLGPVPDRYVLRNIEEGTLTVYTLSLLVKADAMPFVTPNPYIVFGAGITHRSVDDAVARFSDVTYTIHGISETRPSLTLGAGIEARLNLNVSFFGDVRYLIVIPEQKKGGTRPAVYADYGGATPVQLGTTKLENAYVPIRLGLRFSF